MLVYSVLTSVGHNKSGRAAPADLKASNANNVVIRQSRIGPGPSCGPTTAQLFCYLCEQQNYFLLISDKPVLHLTVYNTKLLKSYST